MSRAASRERKTGRCGAVQFSGCSRSLCIAAGCAYLLLQSLEHEELRTSWKGENPFSAFPVRPHLPAHPSPSHSLASLSTSWPCPSSSLGPGPQHATGEAAQLQRISCSLSKPRGLSLQRGKKSWGMAKVWWHNASRGSSCRGSFYTIVPIITGKVSSCHLFQSPHRWTSAYYTHWICYLKNITVAQMRLHITVENILAWYIIGSFRESKWSPFCFPLSFALPVLPSPRRLLLPVADAKENVERLFNS